MNIEEALKMQGTPFIYQFSDGDTMEAFVKKFDPEKGLSCWSLSLTTRDGYRFTPSSKEEKQEQAICIIGIPQGEIPRIMETLQGIKDTGKHIQSVSPLPFQGCPL